MPTSNLSTGIAVVIDDEIGERDAKINNLVSQIKKQKIPCLTYKELPEETHINHFQGISFLLLDWKLQTDVADVTKGVRPPDTLENINAKANIADAFLRQ